MRNVHERLATKGHEDTATLPAVVAELRRAEDQCSADAKGALDGKMIQEVREGYDTLRKALLVSSKFADTDKLKRQRAKADKKAKEATALLHDEEEFVFEDEKEAQQAAAEKALKHVEKIDAKIGFREQANVVREQGTLQLLPSLDVARLKLPAGASVKVMIDK